MDSLAGLGNFGVAVTLGEGGGGDGMNLAGVGSRTSSQSRRVIVRPDWFGGIMIPTPSSSLRTRSGA